VPRRTEINSLVVKAPGVLELERRPAPACGPTDVVIRVAAAGICHTDFVSMRGQHSAMRYPTVLGHEFSGVVETCGQSVTHLKPGDRVTSLSYAYCGTCMSCRRGQHTACRNALSMPFNLDGAFQELVRMPAIAVFAIADSFSLEEAALTEPAANGYAAAERGGIFPGERVVVIGPGPVGLLALQAAALRQPADLIVLGTRRERLEMAAALGATQVVNVRETDPYRAIMELTDGAGADVVLFCGGGEDAWEVAGRALAPHGRVVVEGLPETPDTKWPVPVFDFTSKQISYLGVSGYTGAHFGAVLHLLEAGKIKAAPLITHRFALEDYRKAFETVEQRAGGAMKVLFRIGDE